MLQVATLLLGYKHHANALFDSVLRFCEHKITVNTTARRETAREISQLLKQQWRPGVFAMCMLIIDMTFWLFYFFETKKLRVEIATTTWFTEWIRCLHLQATISVQNGVLSASSTQAQLKTAGRSAQDACAWIATPHVPWFPWATLAYLLPTVFGIIVLILFGSRLELWEDLRSKLLSGRSSSVFIMDDLTMRPTAVQIQRQSFILMQHQNSPLAIAQQGKLNPEGSLITEKTSASQKTALAPSPEIVPRQRPKQSNASPSVRITAACVGPTRENALVATAPAARSAGAYKGSVRQIPTGEVNTEKANATPRALASSPETVPRQRPKQPITVIPVRPAAAYIGPIRASAIISTPVRARSAVAYIGPIRQRHTRAVDRHEPLYNRDAGTSTRAQRQQQDRQHQQQQEIVQQMKQAKLVSKSSAPRPERPPSTTEGPKTPSPTQKPSPARKTELTVKTQSRPSSPPRFVRVVSPTTPTPSELINFYKSIDRLSEPVSPVEAIHDTSLDPGRKTFSPLREGSRNNMPERLQNSQNLPPVVPQKSARRRF
ncbi:unnamed protein product [Mortierella alpina]